MSRFSFRARVLLLVVVVAVATAGTTAWLIVWQTSDRLVRETTFAQQDVERVISEITASALLRGSWAGVGPLVDDLAAATGQRVRLTTVDGVLFEDSAPDANVIPARQTATADTHRAPDLGDAPVNLRAREAAFALLSYREALDKARCWQRHGVAVGVVREPKGTYDFIQAHESRVVAECSVGRATSGDEVTVLADRFSAACAPAMDNVCLRKMFIGAIAPATPPPALVLIGALDQPPAVQVRLAPALGAATAVALLVVAASLLISSRVVRPIGALAEAAQRLGRGNLSERVPERGGDEVARLTRAFNDMATSLQQSKEQQHNMIADIAHELRTPLTNIRGYLEALKDGVFPADPELFRSLYDEAMLQHRLLDDLQDLALAESGTLVYHPRPVDLTELVRACRTAHASAAAAAGIRMETVTSGTVPAFVDQERIRQVIGNLVTNALRATPAGGLVTLRALVEERLAVVEIDDTGTGISADDLPHVFDRFWRADTSRGRTTGGSGLGLAIAREIVASHDGTITATSTAGSGSRFTVSLPLHESPDVKEIRNPAETVDRPK